MLKKAGHISLVILLLISTMGVPMYKHYCGNSLISKSIELPAKNCCNNHCKACHNETTLIKIIDNFEVSSTKANISAEICKILNPVTFSSLLIDKLFETHTFNKLFYKVKICENFRSPIENFITFLQVFRL
jgi:hypothetical protein